MSEIGVFSLFFFRTLSTSDDVEDREHEKGRLEEAYEKCDRNLDELIVQHYTELMTAIGTYQSITERITTSRNKIKQVKFKAEDFSGARLTLRTIQAQSYFLAMCLTVPFTEKAPRMMQARKIFN